MTTLTQTQIDQFWRDGVLTVENAVTPEQLQNSDSPEVRQFMGGLPDGPVPYHYPAPDYLKELFDEDAK